MISRLTHSIPYAPEATELDVASAYGIDLRNSVLLDMLSDRAKKARVPVAIVSSVTGSSSAKKDTSKVDLEEY